MSDPRDPVLRQAVDKLMQNAQSLQGLFAQNYQNEGNRPILVSGFRDEGIPIKNNLYTLIRKTQLKSALNAPNSAYNQFISTWNNGTGDLGRSFNLISEFWRLLSGARPELDRLMTPQPGPGPQPTGTSADVMICRLLQSESNNLYEVFKLCVANHTPSNAARIRELSTLIGELLSDSRTSPDAVMKLSKSKGEWGQFIILYKKGAGIDRSSLSQLGHFVTFTNAACAQILHN
jgi:hypothetical protein